MTYDEMISAVVQWVAAASDLPTYRAGQDFDKPAGAYATVDLSIIEDAFQNHDAETWAVDEDSAAVTRHREIAATFSVNIWDASDPISVMGAVKAAANDPADYLADASGLAVTETGPINPLREFENSRHITRAQMNLTVGGYVTETSATEIIETVPSITIGAPE